MSCIREPIQNHSEALLFPDLIIREQDLIMLQFTIITIDTTTGTNFGRQSRHETWDNKVIRR
jgi:hypothetical protein